MIKDATESVLKLSNDVHEFDIPTEKKKHAMEVFSSALSTYNDCVFIHFIPQIESDLKNSMEETP